jgi:hypothetical protein
MKQDLIGGERFLSSLSFLSGAFFGKIVGGGFVVALVMW